MCSEFHPLILNRTHFTKNLLSCLEALYQYSNFSISSFTFSSERGALVVESELLEADAVVAAADKLLHFLVPKLNVFAISLL